MKLNEKTNQLGKKQNDIKLELDNKIKDKTTKLEQQNNQTKEQLHKKIKIKSNQLEEKKIENNKLEKHQMNKIKTIHAVLKIDEKIYEDMRTSELMNKKQINDLITILPKIKSIKRIFNPKKIRKP